VQVAESYIANNATDQQIEAKLDAVCGDLPSPYNGECTLIVNAYLPQIIAWIQNDEPPATLCAQLSLCSSKKSEVAPIRRTVEQTPCAICELVVQVVESYVANNATDQQIEAKLDALCAKLPSPYSGQCALIVNSYLPQIISYIQNNESPATVCAQLSLCSSKPAPVKREVEQSICAVCELVVQVAENYVENNATLAQIEAKLDSVCGDLPTPYNGECTLIVNSYLPQIVTWLQNDEPPATVCGQLSLCTSKKS
jgi:saposin